MPQEWSLDNRWANSHWKALLLFIGNIFLLHQKVIVSQRLSTACPEEELLIVCACFHNSVRVLSAISCLQACNFKSDSSKISQTFVIFMKFIDGITLLKMYPYRTGGGPFQPVIHVFYPSRTGGRPLFHTLAEDRSFVPPFNVNFASIPEKVHRSVQSVQWKKNSMQNVIWKPRNDTGNREVILCQYLSQTILGRFTISIDSIIRGPRNILFFLLFF